MELKFYNTLTNKKEIFKSLRKGEVKIYGCGPTVYWHQHIGNLFRYIFEDYLIRVLKYNKYKLNHIINITDVGHLTSDEDSGDDKMEIAAQREKKSAKQIAQYYIKIFKQDLKKLNITEPDVWPKATEHIKEQIDLIKILEKKGYTYKTTDGIYFDTSKVKDYGKLGNINIEGLKAGKRINLKEKKNKTDFALWKFSEKPGVRQQEWKSPWGIGFPGWHIECSAMSSKYLGKQFDIHTGGEDHIQIHHTNEIAQSESAFGKKPWVKYWLHSRWLLFKGEKMSKSKGGIFTLSDLEEKGFSPLEYRYLCLTTHYRKQLNFSIEILKTAQTTYQRLKTSTSEIIDDKKINKTYLKEFENAINDDLNISNALQVLWKLLRDKKATGKYQTIKKMDEIFGLDLFKKNKLKIPKEINDLIKQRNKARGQKDWEKSDALRDKITKLGYSISDKKNGIEIKQL